MGEGGAAIVGQWQQQVFDNLKFLLSKVCYDLFCIPQVFALFLILIFCLVSLLTGQMASSSLGLSTTVYSRLVYSTYIRWVPGV